MNDNSVDLLAVLEEDIFRNDPVALTLRKVIVLGGRAGSSTLREWAALELNGYDTLDATPSYRRISAPIMVDVQLGNHWRTGQTISPSIIPEFARELFESGPVLFDGIGSIEAMAADVKTGEGSMRMSHPRAMDVCAVMDKDSGNPFQQTTALYWTVTYSSLLGVVEQVRTRLAELVGEMRAHTPLGQDTPSAEVASEAVRLILEGGRHESKG